MKHIVILFCILPAALFAAPAERKDIRAGNRDYKKGDYKSAEIDYRRALDKVAESVNAKYNLGDALMKQLDSAAMQNPNTKDILRDIRNYYAPMAETGGSAEQRANAYFNRGNTYLIEQDWNSAVEEYKKALRLHPGDMAAKENLVFAQAMSQNAPPQQQQQNKDDKNQDKDKDKDNKDKDNSKDNQDQQNDSDQDQKQQQPQDNSGGGERREEKISRDDAQRLLQALEQQEKDAQDRVKKEKAQRMKKRSSDKNW